MIDFFLTLLLISIVSAVVLLVKKKRRYAYVAIVIAVISFIGFGVVRGARETSSSVSEQQTPQMSPEPPPTDIASNIEQETQPPTPQVSPETPSTDTASNNPTIEQETKSPESLPSSNIKVISVTVKKVDGKCRYFFDVRNAGENSFEGEVSIVLVTDKGLRVGIESFNTTRPIEPGLGISEFIDINTCPSSQVGAGGVEKFSFEVRQNKTITQSGEDVITATFESI